MSPDLSAIAVLLPKPLLDRLEHLQQSRNLSSIQEALLIVISEYFAGQPNLLKANFPKAAPTGNLTQLEARLSRTEALLAAAVSRISHLEANLRSTPLSSIAPDLDDVEDEPDEVLQSFLEPRRSLEDKSAFDRPVPDHSAFDHSGEDEETYYAAEQAAEKAIAFGRNLGWRIQPDGKAQPMSYEDIEEEPDEILYDFLEPG
jgi:hypothetical protein